MSEWPTIADVLANNARSAVEVGDCLDFTQALPDKCVDLVLCSPPYEKARTYGIGYKLTGEDWVAWALERFMDQIRICRGLVCWVAEGQTKDFRWSATPALLMADLCRAGVQLRKPPIFHRIGIPGSGGPDWWRNDYEFCICGTADGRLPWSDNTATGHPPKWAPGGEMSYRQSDGSRVNQWGHPIDSGATVTEEGGVVRSAGTRPSHRPASWGEILRAKGGNRRRPDGVREKLGKIAGMVEDGAEPKVAEALANGMKPGSKLHTKNNGDGMRVQCYDAPVLANPGNVIEATYTAAEVAEMLEIEADYIHCLVGGGLMGDKRAHENEAPFPESLVEPFILSFCPPDGVVYDCFTGSGTTAAVALRHKRRFIGTDVRQSQVDLTRRRIAEVQPLMF